MGQRWDQFLTNIGNQSAPFGFAPGSDPKTAGMNVIGGIGANMLANITKNPLEAFGGAYQQQMADAKQGSRDALSAKVVMDQMEEKKRERAKEQELEAQFNQYVSGLPPDQQALARFGKKDFIEAQIKNKFPGADGGGGFFGTPLAVEDDSNNFAGYGLPSKSGQFKPLDPGKGKHFMSPYDKSLDQSTGKAHGTVVGAAQGNLPGAQVDKDNTITKIDFLLKSDSLGDAIGYKSWVPDAMVGNGVIDTRGRIKELMGGAFLNAYATLKGGGQITEIEGSKAEAAYQRMETAIKSSDPETFKEALRDFKTQIEVGFKKLSAIANGGPSPIPAPMGGDGWSIEEVQ